MTAIQRVKRTQRLLAAVAVSEALALGFATTLATLAIVACTAVAINVARPLATAAIAVLGITVWFALRRLERQAVTAEARRLEAARQLDRRISELFSLQGLSYVLAESIELDRIAASADLGAHQDIGVRP